MMRAALTILLVALLSSTAWANDPKRKVAVIEYRSGSAALQGIAKRVAAAIGKATSLDVLGPDQMRAVYGDSIDQAIVKCSGEAECVAKIGQKVGAVSIILVGISELGDAILTMQLIDVKTHAVGNRIADSLPVDKVPTDANVDAYLQRLLPPTDFVRFGVIDIVANLSGASVTVGGKPRGVTPIETLKLPAPATYDIRIEKQGYVPYTTKLKLPPDGTMRVEANLSKKGAGAAWYQHWYVLAGAGLLVAGAAGTTIYFATAAPSNDRIGITGEIR